MFIFFFVFTLHNGAGEWYIWVVCVLGTRSSDRLVSSCASRNIIFLYIPTYVYNVYMSVCVCNYVRMYVQRIFIYIRAERKSRAGIDRQEMTQTRRGRFSFNALPHMDNQGLGSTGNYIRVHAHSNGGGIGSYYYLYTLLRRRIMRHFHNRRRRVYARLSCLP